MKKRIQRKIDNLREQPEHIRMRAASVYAAVGGIVAVALWLIVFLPLQLRFVNRDDQPPETPEQVVQQNIPTYGTPAPQVGGVQDIVPTSTPTVLASPELVPFPDTTTSPTPTPTSESTL